MASLFGKNKLRDIALSLNTAALEDKIAIVKAWQLDYKNGSLRQDKETSREQAYNQDFFIRILGYKEKPSTPYSFEPKATTEKGQLPDAVIGHTDTTKDVTNIAAVVELKGATVALDRPQRREGNMSPVQQGFKYKTQYRNCPFVIVSNFWELRLYHDNQLDYEVWTLDDLVDPKDDYLKFKIFYTLLHSDNFTSLKGSSKTEDLLSDIRFEQEEIGKKFYKVYGEARLELLRDIYRKNELVRSNIDIGIEKAQKIIDRVVFACFAEDKGLLPDNTLQRVIKAADSSVFGGSLWNTLKGFFEAIDVGSDKLEIPDGYNGGLFRRDEALNSLKISDEILREVVRLSEYSFTEDLSVTILGHIFEQSISDLEEIKNKVNERENLETLQQSRRKKDGIFYTPDYIVRYIVENSLGAYLREHEEKLKREFRLKGDINDQNYEKREKQAYAKYQQFLQNVRILDPACGSGAFLVYVFDFLLAENKRVASILGNNLFSSDDYIKSILQNNIYGVDLNEESVEITKLSLWLKTAQKGKQLTTLDQNIKCGNSLIDDPVVADEKAFNWQQEFPQVFKNGGFDVVLGNPPWVTIKRSDIPILEFEYYKRAYKSSEGFKLNLYPLFVEKSINSLLKHKGIFSMIIPNRLLDTPSYKETRRMLLDKTTIKGIQNVASGVFTGVVSGNIILTFLKEPAQQKSIEVQNFGSREKFLLDIERIRDNDELQININTDPQVIPILNKIKSKRNQALGELCDIHVGMMVKNKKEMFTDEDIYSKRIVTGRDLGNFAIKHRYYFNPENIEIFGGTKDPKKHEFSPKVFIRKTGNQIIAAYDKDGTYAEQSVYLVLPKQNNVSLEYICGLLNSKIITLYFRNELITNPDAYPYVQHYDIEKIPIIISSDKVIHEISKSLIEKQSLFFDYDKMQKKYVEDNDFEREVLISKKIVLLKQEINHLRDILEKEVYKLYDLTSEEIKIVEEVI